MLPHHYRHTLSKYQIPPEFCYPFINFLYRLYRIPIIQSSNLHYSQIHFSSTSKVIIVISSIISLVRLIASIVQWTRGNANGQIRRMLCGRGTRSTAAIFTRPYFVTTCLYSREISMKPYTYVPPLNVHH